MITQNRRLEYNIKFFFFFRVYIIGCFSFFLSMKDFSMRNRSKKNERSIRDRIAFFFFFFFLKSFLDDIEKLTRRRGERKEKMKRKIFFDRISFRDYRFVVRQFLNERQSIIGKMKDRYESRLKEKKKKFSERKIGEEEKEKDIFP